MENYDKILELLQKKELSKEEKILLDSLLEDKDAEKLFSVHKKLQNNLGKYLHPTTEELGDYILVKNQLEPENKSIHRIIPKIEEHIRNCERCLEEFKMLNGEYNNINDLIFRTNDQYENKIETSSVEKRKTFFPNKYALASLIVFAALFTGLIIYSYLSTPENYKLASVNDNSEFYVTRGRLSEDFQESLKLLEEKNYKEAAEFLKRDIEKNSNDETIFYSYYILGLTHLENAEKSFIGLFPSYNRTNAEEGLKNLGMAVEKNTSGRFNNINLDAYFYMAKAYLMLNQRNEAKECLTKVVAEKGSKMDEAKRILTELG